jgi:hypothetical protein
MKILIITSILLIPTFSFADDSNLLNDIFRKQLVTNYNFKDQAAREKVDSYKVVTPTIPTQRATSEEEYFNLIYTQYFYNSDESFNQTSVENVEVLKMIISHCLNKSLLSEPILLKCSSDDLIDKIDYLTEEKFMAFEGTWVDMINDLYEIAYLIQDNKDSLINQLLKNKVNISTDIIKKETETTKTSEETSSTILKD